MANNAYFTDTSYISSKNSADSFSKMDPTDEAIFTAGLDDVTTMAKILNELHHEEHSVMVLTKYGLRLVTAGEKVFQVSAFFAASAFQRFKFDHEQFEEINFRFLLKDFIESLNLLRDDPVSEGDKIQLDETSANDYMKTSLYIQYRKQGEPLRLSLENKTNYVINVDIRGFNMGNERLFCPLSFSEGDDFAVIVMNSKRLYDYVGGLDLITSDYVELVMQDGEKPLRMTTRSTLLGEVELEITDNEDDIIKRGMVVSDNCLFCFSYKTHFMKPALEALKSSKYVQMKCGSNGLLCIEHFHEDDKGKSGGGGGGGGGVPDYMWSENSMSRDYNQPQKKRSSVEYFILSEAKPIDACLL